MSESRMATLEGGKKEKPCMDFILTHFHSLILILQLLYIILS